MNQIQTELDEINKKDGVEVDKEKCLIVCDSAYMSAKVIRQISNPITNIKSDKDKYVIRYVPW